VVFPLVHGTYGEDGCLQGLFELADLPYVGSGVLASAAGMDKIIQKHLFRQAHLPTPRALWCLATEWRVAPGRFIRRVEQNLPYPVFVKPANTGSSVGVGKARDRDELRRAVDTAAEYDRRVIVEQGIRNAREIECSVLGNDKPEVSVAGEIISSNEFYDYDAKYVDGRSQAVIPAPLSRPIARRVRDLAVAAYRTLDCAGMARVDFFVARKGSAVYLNELNTLPGFTAISMYPKLWEASGRSFPELLDRLVELAFERHRQKQTLRRTYHPWKDWFRP
jgi:D-alanine-D-alanine ligase